jgi:hypothetical protein
MRRVIKADGGLLNCTLYWPLPIENPWNEEWYKDKEWYKNWWKHREVPQQAMDSYRDYDGVGVGCKG